MEQLWQSLITMAGGEAQLLVLAGVAGGALLAVMGLAAALAPREAAERRLETVGTTPAIVQQLRRQTDDDAEGFEKFLAPQDQTERSATRLRLLQAGYRSPNALRNYFLLRTILGLLLPIPLIALVIYYSVAVGGLSAEIPILGISVSSTVMVIGLLVLIGFYGPPFILSRRIAARQQAMREGFPHALDMMQVAIEAGLGFDSALARVAEELQQAHPILAEEFAIVGLELRGGRTRDDVLSGLARRTGVVEIASFTTVIQQSVRFGTNIADALRVYASEMRFKRQMDAEERANKLPVKMSGVLALLMLPAMLTLALGPVVIRAIRILFPILEG